MGWHEIAAWASAGLAAGYGGALLYDLWRSRR